MAPMPPDPRTWTRYVALGDWFTEGVGNPEPARPNGVRGWADRVAEVLATRSDGFGYANLHIRGRKLRGILAEQVDPALSLEPDLVSIHAGANDVLRPRVDLDDLAAACDEGVSQLADTGARVVMFTIFDPGKRGIYAAMRGRMAIFNEFAREISDRHGTALVDMWRMRDQAIAEVMDTDRMHLNPVGQPAHRVRRPGRPGHRARRGAAPPRGDVRPEPVGAAACRRRVDAGPSGPWVHRRLTGQLVGRQHLSQATRAGPNRSTLSGRVTSSPSTCHVRARRADVAQLVERDLPKVDVASSNLVIRSVEQVQCTGPR